MGQIIYDLVPPESLTSFIREVPHESNQILNQFLPDRQINDIEATIEEMTKVNRAATFRTYDAETPIGERDTLTRRRVLLPPLGQKLVVGEYERIQLERLRTGGTSTGAMVQQIYDDAVINTNAVRVRMELARGDVLTDGRFTLAGENDLRLETDWGVPEDNFVAASIPWSDQSNATILEDLNDWVDQYNEVNGEVPGTMLMSRRTVGNILRSAEMRQLISSLAGTPSIATRAQMNAVLDAHTLPQIREYDSRFEVNGTTTRPIPQDLVILLPSNPASLGYTAWGITAEALELAGSPNPSLDFTNAPGLVGVVMRDGDPVRTWTKVTGVGMPVFTDPRRLMVANVEPGSLCHECDSPSMWPTHRGDVASGSPPATRSPRGHFH